MAHVLVSWTRAEPSVPSVRVMYPNRLNDVVPEADLYAALPRGAEVHGYYSDGPYLLRRLIDARDAGRIAKVVLRPYMFSHPFVRTEIAGTHELTARLWATRTPQVLIKHPVFRHLSPYIPYGSCGAVANLITMTFDPRWYVDARRPDRWARLEQAFALSPRGDGVACPRRGVIRACWVGDGGPPGAANDPVDFFGRRHAALLAAGVPDGTAVRKVGRLLIRAAVAAWLDTETGGDPLFDPTRLFDAAAVAAAARP